MQKMVFISSGNIPGMGANTIQAMKMSAAFSRLLPSFELVTLGDALSSLKREHFDLWEWYGIKTPFRVTRLPLLWRATYPIDVDTLRRATRYPQWAALYAWLRRPDLIYTRSFHIAGYAMHLGMSVVIESHALELTERARGLIFDRRKGAFFRGLVTISPVIADFYLEAGVPEEKILVAHDGVDLECFSQAPTKEAARERLDLPVDAKIAVYAGHLYDHRGVEDILTCAQRMPDVQFVLVGGYKEHVERRKRELKRFQLHNVHIVGFVPNCQVPMYLAAADVLLMPYSREVSTVRWMSPLKMFEYMAARRAILATDLEGIRQVLRNRHNSILVPPDDGHALASGLETLFQRPMLMDRLAEQAYRDVQTYDWTRRAEMILGFLDQLSYGK